MIDKIITDATGQTSPHIIRQIEDSMRNDIFHSTLDWQTRNELASAARAAARSLGIPAGQLSDEELHTRAETIAKEMGVVETRRLARFILKHSAH